MSRTARSLAAVLALSALVVVAACGGGNDDGGDRATGTTATTATDTSTTAAGGAAGGTDGEVDASTMPDTGSATGNTGGTTAGGGGEDATTPPPGGSESAAASPAPPGRYVYDVDGSVSFGGPAGQAQPLPPEARLTVDPPAGERQRSERDATDGEGNGSISETVLVYRSDGVHLESLKLTTRVGTFNDVREFRPADAPLLIPASPGPGDGADFWMQTTDRRITVHVTVAVVGGEAVTIGGAAIDALVVDITSTFSGDIEGKTAARNWIDRSRSLTVKEHSESDVRVGVNEAHSEYDAVLRSVTPS